MKKLIPAILLFSLVLPSSGYAEPDPREFRRSCGSFLVAMVGLVIGLRGYDYVTRPEPLPPDAQDFLEVPDTAIPLAPGDTVDRPKRTTEETLSRPYHETPSVLPRYRTSSYVPYYQVTPSRYLDREVPSSSYSYTRSYSEWSEGGNWGSRRGWTYSETSGGGGRW